MESVTFTCLKIINCVNSGRSMKRLFTMAVAALPAFAMAQVELGLSLNKQNLQLFNAASVGLDDQLSTGVFYKNYWPALSGSYFSTGAFGNYRIKSIASGVGLHYTFSAINNFTAEHRAAVSFAKHIKVGSGTLSAGADVTYANRSIDYAKTSFGHWQDPSTWRVGSNLDLGTGLVYQTDKLEAGFSLKNIFEAGLFAYRAPREFFGHFIYHFRLGKHLKLSPMCVYSQVESFKSIHLNMTATLNERVWMMGGCRDRDAWVAGAGVDCGNGIRLGYVYDRSISKLLTYTSGNHELLVGFRIPDKPIR